MRDSASARLARRAIGRAHGWMARALDRDGRARAREREAAAAAFEARAGTVFREAARRLSYDKVMLVEGLGSPSLVASQATALLGAMLAGFRPVVVFYDRDEPSERLYRALGVAAFRALHPLLPPIESTEVEADRLLAEIRSGASSLEVTYRGISCVKFAISTAMRKTRRSDLTPRRAEDVAVLRPFLVESIRYAEACATLVDELQPDTVLQFDKGYTPMGELHETVLARGGRPITSNAAHRGHSLMLRRYTPDCQDLHPFSVSPQTWRALQRCSWSEDHWRRLEDEIRGAYESREWYNEVGTQHRVEPLGSDEVARLLALDPEKKTVVLFPHLFWDATFFWGDDLFENYEEWFVETIKAAAANDRVNWVVKIHPANIVKNHRDGVEDEPNELVAIRDTLGAPPPHIKILEPETPISTWDLFALTDVCVTVRGTVGMEAACLGIPVLTAGTGRYDRKGFTIDSDSAEEFLERIALLPDCPPLSIEAIETARRFAYGVLLARPLRPETFALSFNRDARATLDFRINPPQSPDLRAHCPDLARVADWLESDAVDLVVEPLAPDMSADPT